MSVTAITTQQTVLADDATTVRRFFDAWAAGDLSDLDALVDEHIVLGPLVALLYERTLYHGLPGVADAFRETAARWDRFQMSVEDAVPADGALAVALRVGFEKHGMACEGLVTVMCTVRDGRIVAVLDSEH